MYVILVVAFVTVSSSTVLLSLLQIRKAGASINAVKTLLSRPSCLTHTLVHYQLHSGYLHVLHAIHVLISILS